ncbi:gamma-type small acid-soluble spore protein [Fredinandcohnia onubensis]|uniref:gamma-type small acid-soluble spore protein n=1 Tax=Fredinandcohnia onubensis TaxID=1571209 RepID=UPI000C0BF37F|nr:gamma-type small acid-soluble spore protein [Fredinandcohnia onubensis]
MQNNNNQQIPAQAQAALNQIKQTAQQLAQTEQMNAQQFQQSSPQVQQSAPGFAGRELNAAQQLNQIEQSAQQLQQSVGQQQFTSTGSSFSTEFASETDVAEVRKQNQQSQANKNR